MRSTYRDPVLRRLFVERAAVPQDELEAALARLVPGEDGAKTLAFLRRIGFLLIDESVEYPEWPIGRADA